MDKILTLNEFDLYSGEAGRFWLDIRKIQVKSEVLELTDNFLWIFNDFMSDFMSEQLLNRPLHELWKNNH